MSPLKELTFRVWLLGTFSFRPMSLAGQKPKTGLGMEKYNHVVTVTAAVRRLLWLFARPGSDTVRKHYGRRAGRVLGS